MIPGGNIFSAILVSLVALAVKDSSKGYDVNSLGKSLHTSRSTSPFMIPKALRELTVVLRRMEGWIPSGVQEILLDVLELGQTHIPEAVATVLEAAAEEDDAEIGQKFSKFFQDHWIRMEENFRPRYKYVQFIGGVTKRSLSDRVGMNHGLLSILFLVGQEMYKAGVSLWDVVNFVEIPVYDLPEAVESFTESVEKIQRMTRDGGSRRFVTAVNASVDRVWRKAEEIPEKVFVQILNWKGLRPEKCEVSLRNLYYSIVSARGNKECLENAVAQLRSTFRGTEVEYQVGLITNYELWKTWRAIKTVQITWSSSFFKKGKTKEEGKKEEKEPALSIMGHHQSEFVDDAVGYILDIVPEDRQDLIPLVESIQRNVTTIYKRNQKAVMDKLICLFPGVKEEKLQDVVETVVRFSEIAGKD